MVTRSSAVLAPNWRVSWEISTTDWFMGRAPRPLPVDQALRTLGVARAVDRDLGKSGFDTGEIFHRQLELDRAEVLVQPAPLGGAGNRHDPRFPGQQPGQRDLSRGSLFPPGD